MAVRASDIVTLAVLPSPSYVRTYYLLQASNLASPTKPTTNPPASPWTTTEPDFTSSSTNTLYTTMLTAYGSVAFEYGDVQKSSSYEAAKQAFNQGVAAATAAGLAQTAADGKNTVWYSNSTPPGTGHKVNDVWFDGANGNRINTWSGTAWVVRQMGTNAIANLAITNALIANLDAAKITAGTLNAARIGANTIGAEKLMVADLSNMATVSESVPGSTAYANWTSTVVGGWAARSVNTDGYFMFRRQHGPLPFKTGDRIRVTFEAYADVAVNAQLRLWTYPADAWSSNVFPGGSIALTTTPQLFERELTVTAPTEGKNTFLIGLDGLSNRDVRLRNVRAYRMGAGELIVDGSVKARHVEMETGFFDKLFGNTASIGRVRVDHLSPNVGDTLNIGGNAVAINLNSRVDDALVDLEQVRQDADAAQSSADAAGAVADAASQAVATLAAGRVLTAETALAVLSGKIDTYENSFLFLSDGLHIRESTSAKAEMVLTSAGARLVADGVTVSEWNQGQMIVPQIVAKGGQIANHIIDSTIAGHTTWRAIS